MAIKRHIGFSLSELLIALLILGQIATFTIPKVITSQQNMQKNAQAKQAIAMVSEAYTVYRGKNTITNLTAIDDLTPYMNYVKKDTSSVIDQHPSQGSVTCNWSGFNCLKFHDGGVLGWWTNDDFCGTTTSNAIFFLYDPDGTYSGSTTGNGKSLGVWLYTTGKIETFETFGPLSYGNLGTCAAGGAALYGPWGTNPSWFKW